MTKSQNTKAEAQMTYRQRMQTELRIAEAAGHAAYRKLADASEAAELQARADAAHAKIWANVGAN